MNIQLTEIETDKYYWHRYIPEYERLVFAHLHASRILEWGVLNGTSIKFLCERFPEAKIVGIDILDKQASWPDNDDVQYFKVNQGNVPEVRKFYEDYNYKFDLIIDDGSHLPWDQAGCLIDSFPWVRKGGFYIAEDLHSNFQYGAPSLIHILLAIKHQQEIGSSAKLISLSYRGLLELDQLTYLYNEIDEIHFFKRACLPLKCWKCNGNDFDYVNLKCMCGTDLYSATDSLTCIIKKKM